MAGFDNIYLLVAPTQKAIGVLAHDNKSEDDKSGPGLVKIVRSGSTRPLSFETDINGSLAYLTPHAVRYLGVKSASEAVMAQVSANWFTRCSNLDGIDKEALQGIFEGLGVTFRPYSDSNGFEVSLEKPYDPS